MITCRYSGDFSDKESRKNRVSVHERPFHCEVRDCLRTDGFAKNNDRHKYVKGSAPRRSIRPARNGHTRAFHPENFDLIDRSVTAQRGKVDYASTSAKRRSLATSIVRTKKLVTEARVFSFI